MLSFVSKLCIYIRGGLSLFLKQLNQRDLAFLDDLGLLIKGGTAIQLLEPLGKYQTLAVIDYHHGQLTIEHLHILGGIMLCTWMPL